MGFSLGYAVSVLPVLLFYKYLESPDNFLKPCKKIKQGMIFAANGGGGGCGGSDGGIPTTTQTTKYRDTGYRVAIPAGNLYLAHNSHTKNDRRLSSSRRGPIQPGLSK